MTRRAQNMISLCEGTRARIVVIAVIVVIVVILVILVIATAHPKNRITIATAHPKNRITRAGGARRTTSV
jgi:hypothetical protein